MRAVAVFQARKVHEITNRYRIRFMRLQSDSVHAYSITSCVWVGRYVGICEYDFYRGDQ